MKTRQSYLLAAIMLLSACSMETEQVSGPAASPVLYAEFGDQSASRTGFDGTSFQWRNGDRIRVALTGGGTMDMRYSGPATSGAAAFTPTETPENGILYGNGGFALYPSLAPGNCRVEGSTMTLFLKNNYSWSDGNVEAPMMANVINGENLQFFHLGGLLKLTLNLIPEGASKLMVLTPGYVMTKNMPVHHWSGSIGNDRPYVQAYAGEDDFVGIPFTAGSASSRVFYVPMPVGPGENHTYPEVQIYLVDADGRTIPGTSRTATNLRIERAHIKPMAVIDYPEGLKPSNTVTTLFGNVGFSNPVSGKAGGDASTSILGAVRGMGWIVPDKTAFVLEQAQTVRIWDVEAGTLSAPYTYGDANHVPWLGRLYNGKVWFAEKAKAKLFTFDPSSHAFAEMAALSTWSGKSVMDVILDADGNAFVAVRDLNTIFKYDGGDFTGAPSLEINLGKWPLAMEFDADGNLIVATNGCQILKVNPETGAFEAIAGILNAKAISDGTAGDPLTAQFTAGIADIAIAPNGDIYVADTYRVRKIRKGDLGYWNATVTTVAGGSQAANRSGIVDGVGSAATFRQMGGLLMNSTGSVLYISDQATGHIRELYVGDPDGPVVQKEGKTQFRLISWNIQNGMWSGQGDNYNRFVDWVASQDPDVCSWCEARSIYYTGTKEKQPESDRYLVDHWPELAARYGHNYVYVGGMRDNYPQVITSRTPIHGMARIVGAEPDSVITHGATWAQVSVAGKTLNLVALHAWPQHYAFNATDQDASAAAHGGDAYRKLEVEYICKHTIGNARNGNWIMMGDFNSISRTDNAYYELPADDPKFQAQDYIHEHTPYVDIIKWRYPEEVILSTVANTRYDYVFCSPDLCPSITGARIVRDSYTNPVRDEAVPLFWHPSDHLPIIVDFNF